MYLLLQHFFFYFCLVRSVAVSDHIHLYADDTLITFLSSLSHLLSFYMNMSFCCYVCVYACECVCVRLTASVQCVRVCVHHRGVLRAVDHQSHFLSRAQSFLSFLCQLPVKTKQKGVRKTHVFIVSVAVLTTMTLNHCVVTP